MKLVFFENKNKNDKYKNDFYGFIENENGETLKVNIYKNQSKNGKEYYSLKFDLKSDKWQKKGETYGK